MEKLAVRSESACSLKKFDFSTWPKIHNSELLSEGQQNRQSGLTVGSSSFINKLLCSDTGSFYSSRIQQSTHTVIAHVLPWAPTWSEKTYNLLFPMVAQISIPELGSHCLIWGSLTQSIILNISNVDPFVGAVPCFWIEIDMTSLIYPIMCF